jgi:hypothetical protein
MLSYIPVDELWNLDPLDEKGQEALRRIARINITFTLERGMK